MKPLMPSFINTEYFNVLLTNKYKSVLERHINNNYRSTSIIAQKLNTIVLTAKRFYVRTKGLFSQLQY